METVVAETVAKATRSQGQQDARTDLKELRRQAVEAGRERSRKIIKTSRIDSGTGELRYRPAGRLLRDWYLHVYLNILRTNLGEPAEHIDAKQVEDTTSLLRRIEAAPVASHALRAVGVVRNIAVHDAAHAAAEILDHLRAVGARRAVLHAGDERFDGDQVRIHVTRHWYQRCYDNHVEAATGSQQPLAGVTNAEEHQVAHALATRAVRRLIGTDGIPLLTAHNTLMNHIDRQLAAGATGIVPATMDATVRAVGLENLRTQVTKAWAERPRSDRVDWLRRAGIDNPGGKLSWTNLPADHQTKIISYYLDTHRAALVDQIFDGSPITSVPEISASRMFNHQRPLVAAGGRGSDRTPSDQPGDQARLLTSDAMVSPLGNRPTPSERHA